DRRRISGQRVDAGVLLQLRVGREQQRHRLVYLLLHLTEAPAALACDPGPDVPLPDVVVRLGPAKPPAHLNRTGEHQRGALEYRVVGSENPDSFCPVSGQPTEIHAKHSPESYLTGPSRVKQ